MTQFLFKPLPLNKQTIVIIGASIGIGLATAKLAASKGARVVMASKNGELLQKGADEIIAMGGKVLPVVADVTKLKDLSRIRDEALDAFGQINTWVNNSEKIMSGYIMEGNFEKEKNLFEIVFWGTRLGSYIAVEEMAQKGGTLINIGNEVSVINNPLLGIYSASKLAIKAFTDALRSELKDRKIPIEVCLVRPVAIDLNTNANAILKCAVNPQREFYVGGPARLSAIIDTFFPQVKDMLAEAKMNDFRRENKKLGTKIKPGKSDRRVSI